MEVEGIKMQLGHTRNASATLTVQIKILIVMIKIMMRTVTFYKVENRKKNDNYNDRK